MQSGISASNDLHKAFTSLISRTTAPLPRALLAAVSKNPEQLVPYGTISSQSSELTSDLSLLTPHLNPTTPLYIILREDISPKCVVITYVPDSAPVRQKMLFASCRLTLVRELGTEHISSTLFLTDASELTPEGWEKHLAHGSLSAPLTEEERNLTDIREAEAQESMGTGARRGGHMVQGGVVMPIADEAVEALVRLREGGAGLVQLAIDRTKETIVLVDTSSSRIETRDLHTHMSTTEPRYSFYKIASAADAYFIYTCPPGSSVKDRMVHAASLRSVVALASSKAGIEVARKIEAGMPDEVGENELGVNTGATVGRTGAEASTEPDPSGSMNRGFARPKRPGRR